MHHSGPNTGVSPSAHDMAPGDRHRHVAPRTEPRKDRAVHLNCKEAELARQRSPGAAQRRAVWRCSRCTSSSSTRPESLTTRSYCALLATSGHSTKHHNHELLRRPRASRHRTPSVAVAPNNSSSLPYAPCPMLSERFQSPQPASVRTHPRSSPHCHAVASSASRDSHRVSSADDPNPPHAATSSPRHRRPYRITHVRPGHSHRRPAPVFGATSPRNRYTRAAPLFQRP